MRTRAPQAARRPSTPATPDWRRIREQFRRSPSSACRPASRRGGAGGGRRGQDRSRAPTTSIAPTARSSRSTRPTPPTSTRPSPSSASGDDLVLHYAIADVGLFVDPGDAVDEEAWKRGVTVYLPDAEVPGCTRRRLSEGAASLLPDGPRPAVVFTVRIDGGGDAAPRRRRAGARAQPGQARLRHGARRTTCPPGSTSSPRRIERGRGSPRRAAGRVPRAGARAASTAAGCCGSSRGWRARTTTPALSLATNLAVADALLAAGTGLFRVMAEPTERPIERLRHTAHGVRPALAGATSRWPTSSARCDRGDPRRPTRSCSPCAAPAAGRRYEDRTTTATIAVALGDGRDVRPRHGAAAPAGRPLRRRGRARRRRRASRCPTTSRRRSASCRR